MFFSCLAALAAVRVWAGPLQPAQIPRGARWAVHLDFERLKQGELGRFCLAQLGAEQAGNPLAALTSVYAFDPRRDLNSATLAGKSNRPDEGVAIFRGAFDAERLVTLLRASPTYQCQTNHGVAIHSWVDEKKAVRQYGAIRDGAVVVLGEGLGMVTETLDTLAGRTPGLDPTDPWAAGLSAPDAFFAASLQEGGFAPPVGSSRLLAQTERTQIALAETGDAVSGTIQLHSRDAATASNVFAVAQGLLGLAWMNREKDPGMADFAAAVRLHRDGNATRVQFTYPAQKALAAVEAWIAGAREAKARAATAVRPSAPPAPAAKEPDGN